MQDEPAMRSEQPCLAPCRSCVQHCIQRRFGMNNMAGLRFRSSEQETHRVTRYLSDTLTAISPVQFVGANAVCYHSAHAETSSPSWSHMSSPRSCQVSGWL